ncbi:hypothetical protein [Sulfurimonas sp.]|uniref:hypothetical protein n=1 Tax=Sulfurimonas sp. TaxID=2022749 RepID=UPI002AB29388|nr:hypothetical protein [Sulfurimonas sp.]
MSVVSIFFIAIIILVYVLTKRHKKSQSSNIQESEDFFQNILNSEPDHIIAPEHIYTNREEWEADEKIMADYQEELFRQEYGLDNEYEDLDDFLKSQDEELKKSE